MGKIEKSFVQYPLYPASNRSDKLNYYVKKMTFILIINRVE
ncbi:hypothetical protein PEC311524_14330 [Pectobacterium carotovorum subsp. carotovorum]|nr:hypothetical protein PEC311524_14330 [Pectobacterium carotovorum subsp. carotovorum]